MLRSPPLAPQFSKADADETGVLTYEQFFTFYKALEASTQNKRTGRRARGGSVSIRKMADEGSSLESTSLAKMALGMGGTGMGGAGGGAGGGGGGGGAGGAARVPSKRAEGVWVWLEDPDEGFVAAHVVSGNSGDRGGNMVCELPSGERRAVTRDKVTHIISNYESLDSNENIQVRLGRPICCVLCVVCVRASNPMYLCCTKVVSSQATHYTG